MKHTKVVIFFVLMIISLAACSLFSNKIMADGYSNNYPKYTVKAGESLYTISHKFGISITAIKQSNGLKSDTISAGQNLRIPDSGSNIYVVKNGDTLYLIAQKYNLSASYLKWANSLKSSELVPGQILRTPSSKLTIFIDKSDHTLTLISKGMWLKTYHVELGDSGLSDKKISGDHKTPEGTFYVAEKSVLTPEDYYLGTRWMRVSYPNIEDADRGLNTGLINQKTHDSIVQAINNKQTPPQRTALGGGVGIHGGSKPEFGKDWTFGCTGLTNHDVQDFFDYIRVGTPIIIQS